MKRVGVILTGCGFLDGSEIHESVLTLLALDKAGVEVTCFSPDKPQSQVINHFTKLPTSETRNVLTESARIARGKVQPLSQADAILLDALIIPGGAGTVSNLSDFALKGVECEIDADLVKLAQAMHQAKKPLGLICIAPVLLPKLLGVPVRLTIGNDVDLIDSIEEMGGEHVTCPIDDIVLDIDNLIVTTPGYMVSDSISAVAASIENLVNRVLDLANTSQVE